MKNEENRAFYLHVMTDQKTSMEKTLSIKKEYKNKKKILQHQQCCCCKKAQKIKIPHLAKLPACLPMSTRLHKNRLFSIHSLQILQVLQKANAQFALIVHYSSEFTFAYYYQSFW